VAYVVIKTGNAPRPGVWSLERSVDNGRTFSPWQHFATSPSECRRYFGIETLIALTQDDSVKCSTEYSSIPPFENGEVCKILFKRTFGDQVVIVT
jgi:laminin alpha 3/5